ncbi:hypothetical protein l11_04170 [Neisseria weaveri LMG 5135]|nr:hypothetical protein l11_04170 [Neisseria weaveri LMG 5135]
MRVGRENVAAFLKQAHEFGKLAVWVEHSGLLNMKGFYSSTRVL